MKRVEENGPSGDSKISSGAFKALPLVFELGYLIALPLVGLALLGRFADKLLGTTPWLLLTGIIISIALSSYIVYRKVTKIINN